jgi:hypothetical protein
LPIARLERRSHSVIHLAVHSLAIALALLAVAAVGCDEPSRTPGDGAAKNLVEQIPGFIVWESNRSGDWRIWMRRLDGSGLRQLTPDEEARQHFAPHLSPDGRHLVYLSQRTGTSAYRMWENSDSVLRLLRIEDGHDEPLVKGARSYREDRAAVWLDSREVIYIAPDGTTRSIDILSRKQRVIQRKKQDQFGYLVDPTLTWATTGRPGFARLNRRAKRVAPARILSGCQPYFSRDGRFGFWVNKQGGPVRRVDLRTSETADIVTAKDVRLPEGFRYVYFPMLSAGQDLLAYAASDGNHHHFRADYEVFVAPVDPDTLQLSGQPVRYTFDPGTDRFPDVFESGAELGRHRGEAPYVLRLRAPDDAAGWSWDFGDDATATGKTGEHTYAETGVYTVTARRGDTVLTGKVRADPGGPPRPLRTTVGFDHNQVRVHFDEPVVIDDARFRFERAGPAGLARLEPGSQSVIIRAPRPIDQADVLIIEGVRDTALKPNRLEQARVPVEPHDWPSRRDAMTLAWSTGDRQVIILDRETGLERSDEAVAHGRARLDHHYRMDVSGGRFQIHGQSDLGKGLSDAFALELTLEPDRLEATEPGVVAGMGHRDDRINFLLLQEGSTLVLQLRTSDTPESGARIPLGQLNGPGPHHLIVTYTAGKLAAYLDGEPMAVETPVSGTLRGWSEGLPLVIGAAPGGGRPWHGVVEGVALYGHFVSPDEARRNAIGYAERREQRNAVDPLRVLVRRRALSRTPTPEEITPYREGLVVHEYDVLDVRQGELGEDVIRVAHFAVQGGDAREIAGPGLDPIIELELESFDENPQVQDIYQADDLELDLDVPLYLDVGP